MSRNTKAIIEYYYIMYLQSFYTAEYFIGTKYSLRSFILNSTGHDLSQNKHELSNSQRCVSATVV